jgi:hypothetical protein
VIERVGSEVNRQAERFGPIAGMVRIIESWPAAVGPAVAARAWPARLSRDGTLHVATESSAWAFELAQLAPTVLERLRERLGGEAPAALRFAPGRLPETAAPASPEPSPRRVQPTSEHRRRGLELAREIEDDELRELVARAVAASLAPPASDRAFW